MNKRTLFISVLVFLLGSAIVSTFLSAIMPAESTGQLEALSAAHHALVKVEAKISEVKPVCEQLDSLRLQREELVNKTNEIINSTTVSFKEAATPQTIEPENNIQVLENNDQDNILDLDKLAYAVAVAETGNCTKGSGVSKKNCFGIMEWPNGKRQLKTYNSTEESYADFKRIWSEKYGGGFPTYYMAQKWTGNHNPDVWLSNVKAAYGK